ncbi:aldehyde dehydrogenase family protein [Myxococcota bacterium]|nr:aldehyde dehydrogenase family protein [Myxococcota bacterium]
MTKRVPLQFRGLTTGDYRPLRSPNDGSVIAEVETASAELGLRALEAADAARRGAYGKMPAYQRAEILQKVAAQIRARHEELALQIAAEGGKPLKDARIEVTRAANTTQLCAEEATRIKGETVPMDGSAAGAGRTAFIVREPIGVTMAISAFNHPLNLIAHQVGPAIAAGCPVIVKPASTTPLSAITYVEMCRAAGLPEDAAIVMVMGGRDAEKVATDPRVRFVSFIGSGGVGWALRRKIADGTRIALEHGGTAPAIVEADADLDDVIPRLVKGGFYHAGQVCVSVQRIFAHRSIASALAERIAAEAQKLVVGDARDAATDVGPIITKDELDRVGVWVEEAKAGGAKILCGASKTGYQHYAPTVILEPKDHDKVVEHEVFGPVVDVLPYDTLDEAITRANAVADAFQASIFTTRIGSALSAAHALDATAVMVNDHTAFRVDWMPFGGRKQSGLGLGGVAYSVHELTEPKLIVLR